MGKISETRANKIDRAIISWLPIGFGIIAYLVISYITKRINYIPDCQKGIELLQSIIDVWGILLGFIITAVSILLTLGENSYITDLVESNHMQNIIYSYVMASVHLFVTLGFIIVLLIVQRWNRLILCVFVGMNICVGISVGICVFFLFSIAMTMHKSKTNDY